MYVIHENLASFPLCKMHFASRGKKLIKNQFFPQLNFNTMLDKDKGFIKCHI